MSQPDTLLLRETGVARYEDGREAVNVGPIIAALGFLTEGRGEDRGTDEQGQPLPDLLSLAFEVVKSIILGGRQADYFRQVKLDFDAHVEGGASTSLSLAKQASAVRRSIPEPEPQEAALGRAATELQARLAKLQEATSQLVLELSALQPTPPRRRAKPRKGKAKPASKPRAAKKKKTKTRKAR